jgi:hypothetical protein
LLAKMVTAMIKIGLISKLSRMGLERKWKGPPGGCPRRLPLVLLNLGVIHGRWCCAALEMRLGVFLGERRVGRQDDVDRAFLIERATVEPSALG